MAAGRRHARTSVLALHNRAHETQVLLSFRGTLSCRNTNGRKQLARGWLDFDDLILKAGGNF